MGQRRDRNQPAAAPLPVDTRAVQDIVGTDNPELLDRKAQDLGKNLVDVGLATSQIRNIFGTARKLQANWLRPRADERPEAAQKRHAARRELVLLKPKLAYLATREPAVRPLKDWLLVAIDAVRQRDEQEEYQRFARFMDFFEATLAYHAAFGGKQEEGRR